jgi:hypothetical protein
VVPHVGAAWITHSPRGSTPLFTLLQVPLLPGRLQARHAPPHALSQQTPWTQKLLEHSVAMEQAAPAGLSPQLLMSPFIPQVFGGTHCALEVQALKQRLALQW